MYFQSNKMAAIAQWIRLRLLSCGARDRIPSTKSMLHFFQFKNLNSNMKRTKINKKRLGLAHISWKIHYICRDLMSAKPNIGKDASSVTRKNRQMSMKVAQKWFHHAIISIREQCYKHILVVKGCSLTFVAFLFNLEAPLRLPSVWPDKNC